MPGMVACCMPDGSCVGYVCTIVGGLCVEYNTCLNNGGFPYFFNGPDGLGAGDVCGYAGDTQIIQGGSCEATGACLPTGDPSDACDILNVGQCCGGVDPGITPCYWTPGAGCPIPQVYELTMRPYKIRAFPHRIMFSVDPRGDAPWNTTTPCTATPCDDWNTMHQRCGVVREEIFRRQTLCCSPDIKEQIGYLRLAKRRFVCQDPDNYGILPQYQNKELCEGNGKIWRWDGRATFVPAVPLILTVNDFEDCSKPTKLFLGEGFWRPKFGSFGDRCVDPVTFQVLNEYPTQSACESAGKLWRPGTVLRPPRWTGILRTIGDAPPALGAPTLTKMHAERVFNNPGANEYDWIILLPVEPLDALPENCCAGSPCVPYCGVSDPDLTFPVRDTRTREIMCMTRDYLSPLLGAQSGAPYHNRSFGDEICGENQPQGVSCGVNVPAGIRGIVGHSTHVRNALLDSYCVRGGLGCPPHPQCLYDNCQDVYENVVRTYFAVSAPIRYEWTDDPQARGWWIDYVTHLHGWFTQDSMWMAVIHDQIPSIGGIGRCYRPQPRWAAWYEGKTIATWPRGAERDSDFVAWVLTRDSGFGLEFSPKYNVCNDALFKFADQPKALADTVYPPAAIQASCDGVPNESPPCIEDGHGNSHWYMRAYGAPFPHDGLYHETRRKRFITPEKTSHEVEYGWAKLAFSTGPPRITRAPEP